MEPTQTTDYSFMKGWRQLPQGEIRAVRSEICAALGGVSFVTFYARLKGKPEPKVSEAKAIEEVFSRHGITDIWGS